MNGYEVNRLSKLLSDNAYPGCGIVLGITPDGCKSVAINFIMGRSINNRNRIFVQSSDGIHTQANASDLTKGLPLVVYQPVRETAQGLIVTSGNQTDTIARFLSCGESWEAALRTCCFEGDSPNWTPRISGLQAMDGSYKLSILKSSDLHGTNCIRAFYEYPAAAGTGHFIYTYMYSENFVIPSFKGEPERVSICNDMDAFAEILWDNLDSENKIALFLRYTDLQTGKYEQRIINKYR